MTMLYSRSTSRVRGDNGAIGANGDDGKNGDPFIYDEGDPSSTMAKMVIHLHMTKVIHWRSILHIVAL